MGVGDFHKLPHQNMAVLVVADVYGRFIYVEAFCGIQSELECWKSSDLYKEQYDGKRAENQRPLFHCMHMDCPFIGKPIAPGILFDGVLLDKGTGFLRNDGEYQHHLITPVPWVHYIKNNKLWKRTSDHEFSQVLENVRKRIECTMKHFFDDFPYLQRGSATYQTADELDYYNTLLQAAAGIHNEVLGADHRPLCTPSSGAPSRRTCRSAGHSG